MPLVRKYFWILNLVTVLLCAFLAAKATGTYLVYTIPPTYHKTRSPPAATRNDNLPGTRDVDAIVGRNIFCSSCEPANSAPEPVQASGAGDGLPVKSSLKLQLIATLVSPKPDWCFAAILDQESDRTGLFAIGATISGAVVTDIESRRVMLLTGGRSEYIELGEDVPGPENAVQPMASDEGGFRSPAPTSQMQDFADGIRRIGGNQWEINRQVLNGLLSNTSLLARSARIIPSVRNGKPDGFKLDAIRPGSFYSLLGMFNGDTINAVNGRSMSTPDKALELYTKLRSASHVSVSFTRRGAPLTHEYTIR